MFSAHKDNRNTIQVYLVTAMTHVIALEAGQTSQGALKPITPVQLITDIVIYFQKDTLSFYHLTCLCHPACIFPPLLGDRKIKANIKNAPPPQQAMRNSARVAICECLACYVNNSNSIFKSLNNVFLCHRLKYIRNCFIISILCIILLKVHCLLLRIWGYSSTFTPVV